MKSNKNAPNSDFLKLVSGDFCSDVSEKPVTGFPFCCFYGALMSCNISEVNSSSPASCAGIGKCIAQKTSADPEVGVCECPFNIDPTYNCFKSFFYTYQENSLIFAGVRLFCYSNSDLQVFFELLSFSQYRCLIGKAVPRGSEKFLAH